MRLKVKVKEKVYGADPIDSLDCEALIDKQVEIERQLAELMKLKRNVNKVITTKITAKHTPEELQGLIAESKNIIDNSNADYNKAIKPLLEQIAALQDKRDDAQAKAKTKLKMYGAKVDAKRVETFGVLLDGNFVTVCRADLPQGYKVDTSVRGWRKSINSDLQAHGFTSGQARNVVADIVVCAKNNGLIDNK